MRSVGSCRTSLFASITVVLIGAAVPEIDVATAQERVGRLQGLPEPVTRTFEPIEGISYVLGSKRTIGYFQAAEGQCRMTLMIAETVDPDVAMPTSAARISFSLTPGQGAKVESVEGETMVLTCSAGARTVQVTRGSAPPCPSVLQTNGR